MSYDLLGERDTSLEDLEPLADALLAVDPQAGRFELDDGFEFGTDDVQVLVGRDDVAIHVPYHFSGDDADAVMDRALRYAHVLRTVGGFRMWDPQLDEPVGADAPRAAEKLRATAGFVEDYDDRRRVRTLAAVVLALAALAVLAYFFSRQLASVLLGVLLFAGFRALRAATRRRS